MYSKCTYLFTCRTNVRTRAIFNSELNHAHLLISDVHANLVIYCSNLHVEPDRSGQAGCQTEAIWRFEELFATPDSFSKVLLLKAFSTPEHYPCAHVGKGGVSARGHVFLFVLLECECEPERLSCAIKIESFSK